MSGLTEAEREARDLTHAILRHYGYTDDDIQFAEQVHVGRVCDETCEGTHPGVFQTADLVVDVVLPWLAAREEAAHAAGVAEGRAEDAALREALAHVVRDHTTPPNKDRHGYDYRMGWWDAVLYADRIIRGGIRVCEDCPGELRAALAGTSPQGEGER